MPATWDEFLQEASFDGFTFDMAAVRTEGGRELDKRPYPNVDGVEIEDRARAGYTLQVRAVFLGDAYPERYEQFLALLAAGGVRELVHPVHGRMRAAVERWTDAIDSEEAIDCGLLDVTFVEHTEGTQGPFEADDAASLANLVRSACDDVDAANDKLKSYVDSLGNAAPAPLLEAYTQTPAASAQLASSSQVLEADGDTMSQAAIAGNVNASLNKAQSVIALVANYATPEAEALGRAFNAACARLSRLGNAVLASRPPLIQVVIEVDVPLLLFAHARYGDSSRAADLLRLNVLVDPIMLRAGQTLVIYAS